MIHDTSYMIHHTSHITHHTHTHLTHHTSYIIYQKCDYPPRMHQVEHKKFKSCAEDWSLSLQYHLNNKVYKLIAYESLKAMRIAVFVKVCVYLCVCIVCVCVYILYMCVCVLCIYMCVCDVYKNVMSYITHAHTHTHKYAHTHTHARTHTHTNTHITGD